MKGKKAEAAMNSREHQERNVGGRLMRPLFLILVKHTRSDRTKCRIEDLKAILRRLGAESMQISMESDGDFRMIIKAGTHRYTVVHWNDDRTEVSEHTQTASENDAKGWIRTDYATTYPVKGGCEWQI